MRHRCTTKLDRPANLLDIFKLNPLIAIPNLMVNETKKITFNGGT